MFKELTLDNTVVLIVITSLDRLSVRKPVNLGKSFANVKLT